MRIASIYRYPVKGLTPEPLEAVALTPGEMLPHDRRFAVAPGSSRFDVTAPEWRPKSEFFMLMRDEDLAQLRTRFDPDSGLLTIERNGRQVAQGKITEPLGRSLVAQFFAGFLGERARGIPKILESPGHAFSDVRRKVISIIGLPSVDDLSNRVLRRPVNPLRFRANLYLEDLEPWEELTWVGRDLQIGDARLRVVDPIDRCGATNVDPETGARDMNIPLALQRSLGHINTGIYAEVVDGGPIMRGAEVSLAAS